MESKDRGFIVAHYTTGNGTKLTRDQVAQRIDKLLDKGSMTCGTIARTIKIRKETLYNVLAFMIQTKMITKHKNDRGLYEYRKIKECLLAEMFYPSPAEIEKKFKILGRKRYRPEDGTARSFGRGGINPYAENYLNSVYWQGTD